jgi:LacI family transcriptional regulator
MLSVYTQKPKICKMFTKFSDSLEIVNNLPYNEGVNRTPSSGVSKSYREIAAALGIAIDSGRFTPGSFLPTEKELQAEFSVSRTTIRRALAKLIADGHADSVPNRGVVVRRRTGVQEQAIAFVDGATLVLRKLYSRLSATCLSRGYHLVHLDSQAMGLEASIEMAAHKGFAGAFVWSFEGFPEARRINRLLPDFPLVALDHSMRDIPTDVIAFDYFQMAVEAVSHLVRQGRRRIAVTGMLDMLDTTQERFAGYMRGLFKNELPCNVENFVFTFTSSMTRSDTRLLESRLRMEDRPDALFVMQDEFVPEVAEAVLRCGLRIPEDIALITIGDDIVMSVGDVGLTAMHCDWEELADLALDRMLARITQGPLPSERVLARHRLEVRGSCGEISSEARRRSGPLVIRRH